MRVAKWGNSLAVRLPASVVKALKLKSRDEIELVVSGTRRFEVGRDLDRNLAEAVTYVEEAAARGPPLRAR